MLSATIATVTPLVVAALPALAQEPASDLPTITIGIVMDGPWIRNDEIAALFRTEVTALTRLDFDVVFPDDKHLIADWTVDSVSRDINRLLADPEVDIVFAMGVLASNEAIQRTDLPKPVIAPYVINREFQGAPGIVHETDRLVSGVPNLSYLTTPWEGGRDLGELYQVAPFTKVAVFVDARLVAASGVIVDNVESTAEFYEVGFQITEMR